MTEPREYQIVRDLQACLAAVRQVDGYFYDVVATAVKLDPNQRVEDIVAPDGPRPFVVIEVLPELRDYSTISRAAVKVTRPLVIHWISEPTDATDEARMQMFFRGCSDVEKAIAGTVTKQARSGLALQTLITGTEWEREDDLFSVWAKVNVDLSHQRLYGDAVNG